MQGRFGGEAGGWEEAEEGEGLTRESGRPVENSQVIQFSLVFRIFSLSCIFVRGSGHLAEKSQVIQSFYLDHSLTVTPPYILVNISVLFCSVSVFKKINTFGPGQRCHVANLMSDQGLYQSSQVWRGRSKRGISLL